MRHSKPKNNDINNEETPGVYTLSVISDNRNNLDIGTSTTVLVPDQIEKERAQWGSELEFLMSCVAFSVGLGNIWRFPYTAYENGGGAFLIPYIIVLFIIGKPLYYMEMILGQFSSCSCIDIWSLSPAFKGIGYGITISVFGVITYYSALMALIMYYMIESFQSVLPWSYCWDDWGDICFDSTLTGNQTNNDNKSSSAELYFRKVVLKETNIDDGLGTPSWKLVLSLLASWLFVYGVISKGVKSSGKVAYFLALFPYIIMICLLIRGVTLNGAINGIIFLFEPTWSKIFDPSVWYAAVTQSFFSLGVCFGAVTMYSSYNNFDHNVSRDCMIVTTMDLCTSLMAGTTIFSILGNLAYEIGSDDVSNVVRAGTGLAFISYPEALAKFTATQQLFSVLFFLMLFVLGVGTIVAFSNVIISVIKDQFPHISQWKISACFCFISFLIGIVYCTPGGQYILNLIDYFCGTFIVVILASFEVIAISWIYGIDNFIDDIEFMCGTRPSFYWRFCWGILTPMSLFVILIYFLFSMTPLTYNNEYYPDAAYAAGWIILIFGSAQLPIWMFIEIINNKNTSLFAAFTAKSSWGPKNKKKYKEWKDFKELKRNSNKGRSKLFQFLFGRQ
ncbi:sodium-dependent nutrient amino acid transporter 1-like isoform X1 [Vespula pensylvanica]|uniref:sodium-dependent nutrient amino acid transporter 1-like isoform X1 n=1 Tax=Vespula pensylvanica TaxID=30213 RepID=UPI001CBA3B0A|nr:sodium-dependent nutrient amino acid transporter 1-like isoform X1 [Vespula pensylvanica]